MTKARDLANAADVLDDVSSTELSYVNGVTSAIQTQLDAKVAKSLVDAKGDLLVGSANDTVSRLAVASTAGYLLTVDSAEATGLKWAAPAASGGFTLIQRYVPNNTEVQLAFTSISSSYKHLLLVWTGITSNGDFIIRLNNDSGSNYSYDNVSGSTSLGSRSFCAIPSQGANEHTAHGYAWIYDANSSSYWKPYVTEKSNYSNTYGWQDTHYNGMWRSTSAVSSIYIVCDNNTTLTCNTGGSVALYGIQ
jgi:hypothetical protein